jgi:toxin FitB
LAGTEEENHVNVEVAVGRYDSRRPTSWFWLIVNRYETLDALATKYFTGIDVALRIHCDHMQAVELAGILSHAAKFSDDLSSIWTTSVTILEIRFGLQILPVGKRRSLLIETFNRVLSDTIGNRVAPFHAEAAQHSADLMAMRHKKGYPGDLRDTMIAGIVLASNATLAARNTSHFQDLSVPVVNPWAS